jgi:hypothetical protein
MKKLLFFSLAMTLAATTFAQLAIGPRVGIHFADAQIDPDNDREVEGSIGLMAGAVFELGLSEILAIQPEVTYVKRGYDQNMDDGGDIFSTDVRINYFDIGGIIKFRTAADGLALYFGAGPYYSYATSGEVETTFLGETTTIDLDFDDDDTFERGDWTAAFAVGANLPLGQSHLFVDARYLLGLTDIEKRDDDVEVRNRGISISAGLLLPL